MVQFLVSGLGLEAVERLDMPPRVSVLMPMHNASQFVGRALQSVLAQTFSDFELLVINDGSTDGSDKVVEEYSDPRVKLHHNSGNIGVPATLNRGLELATGEYVARLDADDICVPSRLARQVSYMDAHPDVGVCGSWVRIVGAHHGFVMRRPCGSEVIRAFMCLDNPLFHPTVILRKRILDDSGLRYRQTYPRAEDFDLWERVADVSLIDNIPAVLVGYRVHGASVSATSSDAMESQTCEILGRQLSRLGLEISEEKLRFHRKVGHGCRLASSEELLNAESWLLALAEGNRQAGVYSAQGMSAALAFAWFNVCANSTPLGLSVWRKYKKSALRSSFYTPGAVEMTRFALSLLRHWLW
jgi:hypothetical protein